MKVITLTDYSVIIFDSWNVVISRKTYLKFQVKFFM